MIEAVNSVVSNAQMVRVMADQLAASRSFAGDALAVESVARGPVAPYISPHITLDTDYDTAVLQLRDSDTGDVVDQFPSDTALQQRKHQESAKAMAESLSLGGGSLGKGKDAIVKSSHSAVADGSSITVVQEVSVELPQPTSSPVGAGVAQAAITALSIGAQAGQPSTPASVSVTA